MKLKKDLVLRRIAGEYIVVPIGKLAQIAPTMQITSSTAWLWEKMQKEAFTEDSLVADVLQQYDGVPEEIVRKDVVGFLGLLKKNHMLDDGTADPVTGTAKVEIPKEQAAKVKQI